MVITITTQKLKRIMQDEENAGIKNNKQQQKHSNTECSDDLTSVKWEL